MKRLSALLLLLSLFTLTAWTLEDCVEVNFDHPDCDRYTTTTTEAPSTTTSTQPPSTTSTSGPQDSTTTSTSEGSSTTTVNTATSTTIQECAQGMIHQPPLCVPTTVPFFETTTADTTPVISPPEELPFTGMSDVGLLALAGVSLLFLGFVALKYGRAEE